VTSKLQLTVPKAIAPISTVSGLAMNWSEFPLARAFVFSWCGAKPRPLTS